MENPLSAYREAFNRRDLEAAASLFAAHALFEMPLLGQRLCGRAEIAAGLRRMFELTEFAELRFSREKHSKAVRIAEGRLRAKLRRDTGEVEIPLAMVLETQRGSIARLSTYLDARPFRLWADGPLLVPSRPVD
jgi:ketosteroid isomerase-like protein